MKRPYAINGQAILHQRTGVKVAVFTNAIQTGHFREYLHDLMHPHKKGKQTARCAFCQCLPAIRQREKNAEGNFTGKSFWQVTCGGQAAGHYVVAYGKTQSSAIKQWNVGAKR